jgi:hypothetical protein
MNIRELTVEEFKDLVQDAIEEKLQELIRDPDAGLELREEFQERLRASLAARRRGEKGVPMDEVARRVGLDS